MVEEDDVEGEAHGERVDAGAAGDQQPGSSLLRVKPGKPEQAGAEAGRDRQRAAMEVPPRQAVEARAFHAPAKARAIAVSPPRLRSLVARGRRPVQTAVQAPAQTGTGVR